MKLVEKIDAFSKLGNYLRNLKSNDLNALSDDQVKEILVDENHVSDFLEAQEKLVDFYAYSNHHNAWFTQDFVLKALSSWSISLTTENLSAWLNLYELEEESKEKTIGVVMAGNLPLVGFHDYLSILMTSNKLMAKLSSNDAVMLPILHQMLVSIESRFANKAEFTQAQLKNFDAVIATGSDNTSRYFDYYFGKYPHIIRRNRSGVAILTGQETKSDLKNLGKDIFTYYGLGCRSVSKLYVPANYDFKEFFIILEEYKHIGNHHKYFNNYEYNKAIYLVNKEMHRDTGFLLLKEDTNLSSPISVMYYEEYTEESQLKKELDTRKSEIQCIIGKAYIPFGDSQEPNLNDYADGVDTVNFLSQL